MTTQRTWEDNAAEFAALDQGEGWPFARLVACSVEPNEGEGRPKTGAIAPVSGKVSARRFAERAGTDHKRVLRYLDAWAEAAARGWVPDADTLTPADAHEMTDPEQPWKQREGGVYDTSSHGPSSTRLVTERAAENPEFAARLLADLTQVAPAAVVVAMSEAITTDADAAIEAERALQVRYANRPRKAQTRTYVAHDLASKIQKLHRATEELAEVVARVPAGEGLRATVLADLEWTITALGIISERLRGGSLDEEFQRMLGSDS